MSNQTFPQLLSRRRDLTFKKFSYKGVDLDTLLDIPTDDLVKLFPACPYSKKHHRCVHNGKTFNQIEIKPEMIVHYLAEFSISYKPVKHGRPGQGATHSSRFIPLK
ncbi:hypothetical protein N665_1597s0006 [Sinapis alba]|nr:hypothetical protein N665_1597s0006 [Sinapis alba]